MVINNLDLNEGKSAYPQAYKSRSIIRGREYGHNSFTLNPEPTVTQAELMALKEVTDWKPHYGNSCDNLRIYPILKLRYIFTTRLRN